MYGGVTAENIGVARAVYASEQMTQSGPALLSASGRSYLGGFCAPRVCLGCQFELAVIPLSVLDLAPSSRPDGGARAAQLARACAPRERLGTRVLGRRAHNMQGIASAATSSSIGYSPWTSPSRRRRRHHAAESSPLVMRTVRTLEALYRADRSRARARAPPISARRARLPATVGSDQFPRDVLELQALLGPVQSDQAIVAGTGAGRRSRYGSGLEPYGAQLAAALALPYAFASHFAPDALLAALAEYGTIPAFRAARAAYAWRVNVSPPTPSRGAAPVTSGSSSSPNMVRNAGKLQPPLEDIGSY